MAHILFDQRRKIGEIEEWNLIPYKPVYKDVLGKNVLMPATPDLCMFVTPKPVNRKSQLTIIEDHKCELILKIKTVKGMAVTAFIVARNNL